MIFFSGRILQAVHLCCGSKTIFAAGCVWKLTALCPVLAAILTAAHAAEPDGVRREIRHDRFQGVPGLRNL